MANVGLKPPPAAGISHAFLQCCFYFFRERPLIDFAFMFSSIDGYFIFLLLMFFLRASGPDSTL
jgi:hypothetical protein